MVHGSLRLICFSGSPIRAWFARQPLFAVLMLVLISCAPRAGIEEFIAYRDAFEGSRAASEAMFDLLEIAEREQQRLAAPAGGRFDPDQAGVFSEIADPPLTDTYRRAFTAISRYNQVMVGLASGETAASLSADLGALGSDGLGFAAAVVPGSNVVGLAEFVPVFQQISRIALTQRARVVFSQELAQNADAVLELMAVMRAHTPEAFDYLRTAGQTEDRRVMLSNWVVLLDRNSVSLRLAANAARDGTTVGDLAAIRASVAEMNQAATALRQSIAQLASR